MLMILVPVSHQWNVAEILLGFCAGKGPAIHWIMLYIYISALLQGKKSLTLLTLILWLEFLVLLCSWLCLVEPLPWSCFPSEYWGNVQKLTTQLLQALTAGNSLLLALDAVGSTFGGAVGVGKGMQGWCQAKWTHKVPQILHNKGCSSWTLQR